MDLPRVERELKKRTLFPYRWGRRQSDEWDRLTNFIYTTYSMRSLLVRCSHFDVDVRDYALNRWYNFWSAKGVEEIFCAHPLVRRNENSFDKLVDFTLDTLPFDHKTSIFPSGFGRSFEYAKAHKRELIEWLYRNQSQQGRKHMRNRLFVVLYDGKELMHWKLKAEIMLLKNEIENYLACFSSQNLLRFDYGEGEIFSDIIWVTRGFKGDKN